MTQADSFGKHEVLHTSHIIGALFDQFIVDHPAVRTRPALACKAADISAALADFYQLCGTIGAAEIEGG